MPIMKSLLGPLGYSQITLNDNPDYKDHAYGYSGYNVSLILSIFLREYESLTAI